MIEWFARNPVASNILMVAIILAGLVSASSSIPVETFPSLERKIINISTSFRGSTPKTSEGGVTLRIEEAIADLQGIKEISSRSTEGSSLVRVEVEDSYDTRELLDDIKVRVDAITTLPVEAERPTISIQMRNPVVIYVAISGDVGTRALRETASRFRESLLAKGKITNIELQGIVDYEMNIQVSPEALDKYNLTAQDVGNAIRLGASDISAGNIQTKDGDILIRSDGQAYTAEEFAEIPIISNQSGKPITLGDVATVDDGFEESLLTTVFNGEPAVMLEVRRVGQQSAIQVAKATRDHIDEFRSSLPTGASIGYWDDDSEYLMSRISAVINSAVYGGILVIILLSLFLRPAVAFWVFVGIPVSFMGAFLFMPQVGGTFNVISLFAFIMVLGIVVDDAIVTGENIYSKIRQGNDPLQSAIKGTQEIALPVTFGILTTVVAFIPLSMLESGRLSFVASQMPMVVIPVLLMSLIESKFVLPSHLAHIKPRPEDETRSAFTRLQQKISHGLEYFVEKYYQPFLKKCINNSALTMTILVSTAALIMTWTGLGYLKFSQFPSVESSTVRISLTMPESTGFATTQGHIQRISDIFQELQKKYTDPETGESVILNILATSGSSGRTIRPNVGQVAAELRLEENRTIDVGARQIAREARKKIGAIPGAQSMNVRADIFRSEAPINIELSGSDTRRMGEVVALLRNKLSEYPSIYDIQDNFGGGKEELKLYLKPRAYSLGLSLADIATQVRHAVFGFQAQRIQRGRDELRVMVRYPLQDRSSINDLLDLPIRIPNTDKEVVLSDVVRIERFESPSSLYRLNRRSILNVTADVDKEQANVPLILDELNAYLQTVRQSYSDIEFRFDGEAEEAAETNANLISGLLLVLIAIYALLAIPFKSYGQPLVVMSIIPFSIIGAILGHILTGQQLSSMSFFGVLALVGVVVNDSLVLVDYINKRREQGMEVMQAALQAGAARFRPVFLTSITTFAGVMPLLLDPSQQAKFLKPMATSLGFGILFATMITLVIIPINYLLARKFKYLMISVWEFWLEFWNKEDKPA